ncbi:TPA: hypothetical protein ACYU8D_004806 [Klebsiella pneumoniae]|uniref:AbiTii domain-containing protein n=2 Tax=Klebsiella pneumoniae TaxID=573 RepID=A0A486MCB6_KLEPN|nr:MULTISPECIES: hypothetical protein [Klebsiella]HBM7350236.1 hypothetical protein [Klebsiella oxytoca]AVG06274.1 hypothetical protein AL516_18235 [Klebsiella pneumoniae]EIW8782780.1 hypothetical protein [Klebsiella pneumoniae]EJL1468903.1 hypothetical protein [Klebsiella pneumoniae]EJM8715579.1 hypothetical protein [Klebsiella pneumoniae]
MSEPMVLRFQRMALDNETSTSDLLRMAKAIAVKLQLTDVIEWIDFELDGYPGGVTVPDYRITRGRILGHNPINGLIPMVVSNQQDEDMLSTVHIRAPITELALAYDNPGSTMVFPLSTEFSNQLQSNQPDFLRFPIVRRITQSKMLNVVEHIRNRLLNWSLELEQQGILGENLQFSQQDKVRAPMTTNNFHFNGNINNAGVIGAENHGFNQHNVQQITTGNFDSLKSYLESLGFTAEDVLDLKLVLDSESTPRETGNFLPKVYDWLGKAGERVFNASLDKVAPLAIEAITKYLGN